MSDECRPATLDDLQKLLKALHEHEVEYLLIGGYALFLHGYHRATTDIDFLFPARRDVGERVKQALMTLPDQAARDLDPDWFEEGENIRVADEIVVDLLLNACGESYETLLPYLETIELHGVPVRTLNLAGLLRTKQSLRDKDATDRRVLELALATARGQQL